MSRIPVEGDAEVVEVVNRRLEVVGETPPGQVTIHAVIHGQMIANGTEVSERRVVVVPPGHEFYLLSSDPVDAVTLHVAERDFDAYLEPPARRWRALTRTVESVEVAGDWATRVALSVSSPSDGIVALISEVVEAMRAGRSENGGAIDSRTAFQNALQYIDAHLADPIRMPELALHSGVGVRRLQRLFRRELQTAPSAYVRGRRLENVRREFNDPLLEHETIAQIATLNGFSHLGRFAADFRARYGETPRKARCRSGQPPNCITDPSMLP